MKQIGIFLAIVVIIYAASVALLNLTSKNSTPEQTTTEDISAQVTKEDLTPGTGDEAKTGDTVSVNYRGTLTDGKQFDSSYDRNEPFSFTLGNGEVIRGWDEGIVGMKVGGKRKLTIPSELGYGNQAQGEIPANSTLVFEVELLSVEKAITPQENPNINL